MKAYRIVQKKARAKDLSGTGAYRYGGRWNSKGTYMLYTSSNSSLAFLEILVHFDESLTPPNLYLIELDIDDNAPIYTLPENKYPQNWLRQGLIKNKELGDALMLEKKYLGIKVRSAINQKEYNYLLNPLFPDYNNLLKIVSIEAIHIDKRLVLTKTKTPKTKKADKK